MPYLREELSRVDESWAAARFDSLPHVVHILTSKDREGEVRVLKEQSDVIEEVVDEVVHAYHGGFNKAIQNYSQILRLFSESAQSIGVLKVDLAEAKKLLGAHNKQLHQLWYRSVTLRHIISLLDQIEGIAKVPARIEKLISEKQFYAAVQLHVQSALMLEREGLQSVGALQDVRSDLTKLRGTIFYKVLEDLHAHLYNKGQYSHNEGSTMDLHENGGDTGARDAKNPSRQIPMWLSDSTPDEFVEAMRKSDAPLHVKYLQTLVECLSMLGKVAAAGAMICQRLRPTIHEIITTKIKAQAGRLIGPGPGLGHAALPLATENHVIIGELLESKSSQQANLNTPKAMAADISWNHDSDAAHATGGYTVGFSLSVLQSECQHLICEILRATPEAASADAAAQTARLASKVPAKDNRRAHIVILSSDIFLHIIDFPSCAMDLKTVLPLHFASQMLVFPYLTRDIIIGINLLLVYMILYQCVSIYYVLHECYYEYRAPGYNNISHCAIGYNNPTGSEIYDPKEPMSIWADHVRQGWRRGSNVLQEGYGTGAVLPEQGIYLAASVYRPVLQFTDKVASMLPEKFSQPGNDGLLAFMENFVKDHFLPTLFVDYRKSVQQAISSPASFRPRASAASYTPSIEKGRPVLQGLLAIDILAKEVLGWAHATPKFADDIINYVQTFLERTYERCRTSYMEAVLEKQSYMLIGRHDIDNLLRLDPASECLPNALDQRFREGIGSDSESSGVEMELSKILLDLRPIRQENLIRDDNKLILLASLSDSLEYVADSIERLGRSSSTAYDQVEENTTHQTRKKGVPPKDLASFAEEYRKLAIDCLKVLRMEMQLETIFHMQEMTNRQYLDDQDAEEPDDFIISLTSQITRRDEEMTPYVADVKRSYIFGGICGIAANLSLKALAEMNSINLFGVQQICRNSIALEQALAAISSIDSEDVQMRLDRVRTYYELLNMPFEALLAFISEHGHLFTAEEYTNLLEIQVPGREIPADAQNRVAEILSG
ncbi:UNVERIFIED_CONTAM: Exocyst complex component SEC8 [Sesamum calycinum]|uniref:Exocyst complex component Sec8 n=1 Tax=Sesamum calycinum TaxID=2727403 RepID=A0AAW2LU86_9LAMI